MTSNTLTATLIGGHYHGETIQFESFPDHLQMAVPLNNYSAYDESPQIIEGNFHLYRKVKWPLNMIDHRVFYVLRSLSNEDANNQISTVLKGTVQL